MRKTLRARAAAICIAVAALVCGVASAPTTASAATDTECPSTIKCVFVPAAYKANGSVADYGNYSIAHRPQGMEINSVVIHDTEGGLEETIEHLQNSTSYVSAHYVIDRDGTVYQMVRTKDVAWHAGNWWYNQHSVGIEHVGFASQGHTDYTPAMYRASAQLVKYLAGRFNFPLDRNHVIGHDNVAPPKSTTTSMNADAGPFWNWQYYMRLLGASVGKFAPKSPLITVAPHWRFNLQEVTGCGPRPDVDPCVPEDGPFRSNFIPLRTAPSIGAPFITDSVFGQGSNDLWQTAGRAFYGQQFAVADRKLTKQGIWYQIWFAGQKAWLFSPWAMPTAFPSKGQFITPRADKTEIPVFGQALPDAADFPAGFAPPGGSTAAPLSYTIKAGERYSLSDGTVPTGYYNDWTFDASSPHDREFISGSTKYMLIQFNGRQAFVRAADVAVS